MACGFPQCGYKFSRPGDLDRHIRVRHSVGNIKPFVCDAYGCFKGEGACKFVRSDKLTSHIKATHKCDTLFTQCPVEGCVFGPSTLDELGVHISRFHGKHEQGCAVLNATSCKTSTCPLWRCRKSVTANKLLGHLESHSAADIEVAAQILQAENLLVDFCPPLERRMQAPSGFTVQMTCPVCNVVLDNVERFAAHLSATHVYEPHSGGYEHFVKWKAAWTLSVDKQSSRRIDTLLPWSPVDPSLWYTYRRGVPSKQTLSCPMCPFVAFCDKWGWFSKDQKDKIAEHHLSFVQRNADATARLYPHRMQILKLCPAFITHPVFSDFDPPK